MRLPCTYADKLPAVHNMLECLIGLLLYVLFLSILALQLVMVTPYLKCVCVCMTELANIVIISLTAKLVATAGEQNQ